VPEGELNTHNAKDVIDAADKYSSPSKSEVGS
jgi:hypothetical protein